MTSRLFRVRPYILPTNGAPTGTVLNSDGLDYIVDLENQLLTQARENASNTIPIEVTSYDLVVLVVYELTNSQGQVTCGAARGIDDSATGFAPIAFRAADRKFAIVVSAGCSGQMQETIAHELGHIFGGDHQTAINGVPIDPTNDDSTPNDPSPYNHPVVYLKPDGSLDATSVLLGKVGGGPREIQYSSDSAGHNLYGTSYPSGNNEANMKDIIYWMWDYVAAYRPYPQSPSPLVFAIPCYCIYKSGYQEMTWTSSDWTLPGQSFEVQRQSGSGWLPVYEGGSECVPFSSPIEGILQRVRIIIEGMLPSEWVEVFLQCDCINGGGGSF